MVMLGSNIPVIGAYPAVRGMMMLTTFVAGMTIPEYFLAFFSMRRCRAMESCLPDALDLPKASVQDNLRYYEIQRARLAQPAGGASRASCATTATWPPSPPEMAFVMMFAVFIILGTFELAFDMIIDGIVQIAAQQASRVGLTTSSPSSGSRADAAKASIMATLKPWTNMGGTLTINMPTMAPIAT